AGMLYRLADLRQGGRRAHPVGAMWQEPGGRQRYKAGQRSAALRRSPMRRRTATSLAPLVVLMILTTSCSTMKSTYEENPKAVLGSIIGLAAGAGIAAAAGGGPGAIGGGGLGGGLVGGPIGKRLEPRGKRGGKPAPAPGFREHQRGTA